MTDGGSTMHRPTGTPESALQILHPLTDKPKTRLVLLLQHELVIEGKTLDATAAVQYV